MKKKKDELLLEPKPQITRQQYLEWRNYIYEIDIQKFKLGESQLKYQLKQKDLEIDQLKLMLLQKQITELGLSVSRATDEYKKFRDKLGQEVGVDLDGAIIDPISLTIKPKEGV